MMGLPANRHLTFDVPWAPDEVRRRVTALVASGRLGELEDVRLRGRPDELSQPSAPLVFDLLHQSNQATLRLLPVRAETGSRLDVVITTHRANRVAHLVFALTVVVFPGLALLDLLLGSGWLTGGLQDTPLVAAVLILLGVFGLGGLVTVAAEDGHRRTEEQLTKGLVSALEGVELPEAPLPTRRSEERQGSAPTGARRTDKALAGSARAL